MEQPECPLIKYKHGQPIHQDHPDLQHLCTCEVKPTTIAALIAVLQSMWDKSGASGTDTSNLPPQTNQILQILEKEDGTITVNSATDGTDGTETMQRDYTCRTSGQCNTVIVKNQQFAKTLQEMKSVASWNILTMIGRTEQSQKKLVENTMQTLHDTMKEHALVKVLREKSAQQVLEAIFEAYISETTILALTIAPEIRDTEINQQISLVPVQTDETVEKLTDKMWALTGRKTKQVLNITKQDMQQKIKRIAQYARSNPDLLTLGQDLTSTPMQNIHASLEGIGQFLVKQTDNWWVGQDLLIALKIFNEKNDILQEFQLENATTYLQKAFASSSLKEAINKEIDAEFEQNKKKTEWLAKYGASWAEHYGNSQKRENRIIMVLKFLDEGLAKSLSKLQELSQKINFEKNLTWAAYYEILEQIKYWQKWLMDNLAWLATACIGGTGAIAVAVGVAFVTMYKVCNAVCCGCVQQLFTCRGVCRSRQAAPSGSSSWVSSASTADPHAAKTLQGGKQYTAYEDETNSGKKLYYAKIDGYFCLITEISLGRGKTLTGKSKQDGVKSHRTTKGTMKKIGNLKQDRLDNWIIVDADDNPVSMR